MNAQKKQQRNYNRRPYGVPTSFKDKVWLKYQRRLDKKAGKFCDKWLGPYVVENISKKGIAYFVTKVVLNY